MTSYLTYKAGVQYPIVDDFLVEWVIKNLAEKLSDSKKNCSLP